MRKLTTKGFYGGCYKKSELDIDDKKHLKLRAKRPNPFLMAQACLKLIYNHNIATTASLTPNSGAFL
ncbi:hypothetical protein HPOKI112_00255 [Helicobacter pylori oki112]|nr:hypothetical protein HPOKI102_00250 [Helicobacter pylori oki102]AHN35562.1 hypothetical protein HPOKI112_00255 [Helicobacter pylori oki112]AHN39872.1 hypothetical protein HPOKI422_00260 [Helicobacter pylori oki422]AHN44222.1 hypothetical protein HPOKI898_00265 [Helicobacter pylori oki898]